MGSGIAGGVAGRWLRLAGCAALVVASLFGSTAVLLGGQPPAADPGPADMVPISQLPAVEQLPAAPLLVGAYAFVWLALLAYVWSVWRRLGAVERELQALDKRLPPPRS